MLAADDEVKVGLAPLLAKGRRLLFRCVQADAAQNGGKSSFQSTYAETLTSKETGDGSIICLSWHSAFLPFLYQCS